jgi:hypothetical protein
VTNGDRPLQEKGFTVGGRGIGCISRTPYFSRMQKSRGPRRGPGFPVLERTAGLEPTPPYWKYGALQSFVRMNYAIPYGATAASTLARRHILFGDTREGRGMLLMTLMRSLSPLPTYGSELLSASAERPIFVGERV